MDRRTFLQINLGLAAGLIGCASQGSSFGSGAAAPPGSVLPLGLFPGEDDPLDLTKPGEIPPSEHPRAATLFGTDPVYTGPAPAVAGSATTLGQTFEHVVVLQLENRAFDHLMGYLYPDNPNFDGVTNKNLSNPIPPYAAAPKGQTNVPVTKATNLQTPLVDPAEEYASINVALYNEFNPPSNQNERKESDYKAPYNLPNGGAYTPPPMSGFITSFYWSLLSMNKPVDYDSYSTIMECFPPSLVPAISQLAQGFAICDNWFCGVPSQTYCNRSFFHSASSHGALINSPATHWTFRNTNETIFDRLTAANLGWTVYYDALDVVVLTRFIHYPRLRQYSRTSDHFKDMTKLYDDIDNGKLPAYSFVQPRFILNTNSYHPDKGAPAIKRGEILVNDLYQAIRNSNSTTGSNFLNTLFVITFDEGGTCYDHVVPPAAVPPGDTTPSDNAFGFPFDRHGQRIPTLLISPWIPAGTVINTQLDATSLIKTLQEKFSLASLNNRDQASTSLMNIPVLSTPRTRDQMPKLLLRKLSADEAVSDAPTTPGGMGINLIRLANAAANNTDATPPVTTIQDALDFVAPLAAL